MQKVTLYQPKKSDYPELINVWERSVRATHHFLSESDMMRYKELIFNEYFDQVDLYCLKSDGCITGFIGLDGEMIQMLFIDGQDRGKGGGRQLIEFAINEKNSRKVEVNEQNEQAVGFYQHLGFEIIERSENDAAGKPYPILTMELK